MDNGQHASLEINELAESLRRELRTSLHPVCEKCCIYRIPRQLRSSHQSQCTPETVSIGPLHYGRDELKAGEEHKMAYLQRFLRQTGVSIEECLKHIRDREAELRVCYAETISLTSDEFVKMILVDAAFLIDFLVWQKLLFLEKDIDPEIWKLENQLPLFILDDLFKLATSQSNPELSFLELTRDNIKGRFPFLLLEDDVIREQYSKAQHFFDLFRLCLQPPHLSGQKKKSGTLSIPAVRELHQAGVKFKLGSAKHLFDIRFENGVLKIPKLDVFTATESLYRNLLAFELHHGETYYLNDYILLVSHLVNARKDVELLIKSGVTEHWLWDTEDEATIFQKFVKYTEWDPENFYYSDLVDQLNDYYKFPCNQWKATLKQRYFNTPWASISVIAAVILLILTFIQTICSVTAL